MASAPSRPMHSPNDRGALDPASGLINTWLLGLAFWGAIGVLWGWW